MNNLNTFGECVMFSREMKFRVVGASAHTTPTILEGHLRGTVHIHHEVRAGEDYTAVPSLELETLKALYLTVRAENRGLQALIEKIGSGLDEARKRLGKIAAGNSSAKT